MEQLVARRAHNPKVVGSSPAPATWNEAVTTESNCLFFFVFKQCLNKVNNESVGKLGISGKTFSFKRVNSAILIAHKYLKVLATQHKN